MLRFDFNTEAFDSMVTPANFPSTIWAPTRDKITTIATFLLAAMPSGWEGINDSKLVWEGANLVDANLTEEEGRTIGTLTAA
jgi:hypothetical protein